MSAAGQGRVLIRYGELALKGKNRRSFEDVLARNLRVALGALGGHVGRERGRMLVGPGPDAPPAWLERATARLAEVPGVWSVSPSTVCEATPEAISATVNAALLERFEFARGTTSFRVTSRRADKRFPLPSPQLDRYVAEHLPEALWEHLRVDLKAPELTIGVDVRSSHAMVFTETVRAVGGLPVGTLGRTVCLLSGGIDSPVAAYLAMKRGCRVVFVSFLSPPYIGDGTREKLVRLVRRVGRFQPGSRLYLVPFTAIQEAIRDHCPAPYRTVLYRRMMQRIGSRVARRERAGALVTGESLGQVASQTLENITCIEAAADLPVLRPLICFDKQETVDVATRIGTLAISNLPEPDCCTVFMPPKPVIRGRLEECEAAEAAIDVEELVRAALRGAELLKIASE